MKLLKLFSIVVCVLCLTIGCGDTESGSTDDNTLNVGENNDDNNDSNDSNDSNDNTKNNDECPDSDADEVLYWNDDPDICDQYYEGYFYCTDDQVKFDDDCGCGCIKPEGDFLCDIDDCPSNTYCSYAGNNCTDPEGPGQCRPKPDACTDDIAETCGCNGTIYYGSSSCAAPHSGVDTTSMSHCLSEECQQMVDDDDLTFYYHSDAACPDEDDAGDMEFYCSDGQKPFVNDCGCGCRTISDDDDDDDNGEAECDIDDCPDGYYCHYSDGVCGESGAEGECVEVPTACTGDMVDNCGCDGEIHHGSSTCAAQYSGVDTHSDPDFCQ